MRAYVQERSAAEIDFWIEARKRRNRFFFTVIATPFIGIPLMILYSKFLSNSVVPFVALITLMVLW